MAERIQFSADHYAPAHPRILMAVLSESGKGDEPSYGADSVTRKVEEAFKKAFGPKTKVYLVAGGGTASNAMALMSMVSGYEGIICTDEAHMNKHEAGAHGLFTGGAQLIPVTSKDAKLSTEQIDKIVYRVGDVHYSSPKVVSITQPTEKGTVYKPGEIKEIVELAHAHGLYVHMDGARIFNAASALNMELGDFTTALGVDVISMGAAKNGGLGFGDAVVFINRKLGRDFENRRKQAAQLVSKMRYIAAQWLPVLNEGLGMELAKTSNELAASLNCQIQGCEHVQITTPVETNGVWASLDADSISELGEKYRFEKWGAPTSTEIRLMTSYAHTQEQVDQLAKDIRDLKQGRLPL